jgi:tRNA G37 N-methylase Trm5
MNNNMANYDIIGNIAIIKFKEDEKKEEKLKKAQEISNQYKTVKTVLEKINKVSGRLRTIKTKHILGEKNLEALYFENNCRFKLNIETCYFSPRLANERMEIAKLANKYKAKKVLVMFSGVAPFSIVIAKHCKNVKRILGVELGKECCKYAQKNSIMNKVENVVEIIQGDVKKVIPKLAKRKEKFDFIVMPRPNLKETFLKQALMVAGKNSRIIYYGFSPESRLQKMLSELHKEAKKFWRKIKITNIKEAGDIAPYEHRYRVEIVAC